MSRLTAPVAAIEVRFVFKRRRPRLATALRRSTGDNNDGLLVEAAERGPSAKITRESGVNLRALLDAPEGESRIRYSAKNEPL